MNFSSRLVTIFTQTKFKYQKKMSGFHKQENYYTQTIYTILQEAVTNQLIVERIFFFQFTLENNHTET